MPRTDEPVAEVHDWTEEYGECMEYWDCYYEMLAEGRSE